MAGWLVRSQRSSTLKISPVARIAARHQRDHPEAPWVKLPLPAEGDALESRTLGRNWPEIILMHPERKLMSSAV